MSSMFNLSRWLGAAKSDVLDVDDELGLKLGASGSRIKQIAKLTASFNPASLAANTSREETITVTGVTTADVILAISKPSHTAGYVIGGSAYVSAADTVKVTVANNTAGASDPAAETWTFVVARF